MVKNLHVLLKEFEKETRLIEADYTTKNFIFSEVSSESVCSQLIDQESRIEFDRVVLNGDIWSGRNRSVIDEEVSPDQWFLTQKRTDNSLFLVGVNERNIVLATLSILTDHMRIVPPDFREEFRAAFYPEIQSILKNGVYLQSCISTWSSKRTFGLSGSFIRPTGKVPLGCGDFIPI